MTVSARSQPASSQAAAAEIVASTMADGVYMATAAASAAAAFAAAAVLEVEIVDVREDPVIVGDLFVRMRHCGVGQRYLSMAGDDLQLLHGSTVAVEAAGQMPPPSAQLHWLRLRPVAGGSSGGLLPWRYGVGGQFHMLSVDDTRAVWAIGMSREQQPYEQWDCVTMLPHPSQSVQQSQQPRRLQPLTLYAEWLQSTDWATGAAFSTMLPTAVAEDMPAWSPPSVLPPNAIQLDQRVRLQLLTTSSTATNNLYLARQSSPAGTAMVMSDSVADAIVFQIRVRQPTVGGSARQRLLVYLLAEVAATADQYQFVLMNGQQSLAQLTAPTTLSASDVDNRELVPAYVLDLDTSALAADAAAYLALPQSLYATIADSRFQFKSLDGESVLSVSPPNDVTGATVVALPPNSADNALWTMQLVTTTPP
jgi:hypothetical protein